MTNEIQELRDWSAGLMGWVKHPNFSGWFESVNLDGESVFAQYKNNWTPDKDANQCFMVVERMRELGWKLMLDITDKTYATFWKEQSPQLGKPSDAEDTNPCLAILKAAKATGVKP